MINGQRILAIIPARGGSKGVPGKNIRDLCGKPLIAWTIQAAQHSKFIDRIILSSDDEQIISTANAFGCESPFVRKAELSKDDTPTIDVVLDALDHCHDIYQWVMLLQPTSPLRSTQDIDNVIQFCIDQHGSSCATVSVVEQSPYWMYTFSPSSNLVPVIPNQAFIRRQDLPICYALNGAIYFARIDRLIESKKFITEETIGYVMPAERSIDIDTEIDLDVARLELEKIY